LQYFRAVDKANSNVNIREFPLVHSNPVSLGRSTSQ
jgi:hypothetical protein